MFWEEQGDGYIREIRLNKSIFLELRVEHIVEANGKEVGWAATVTAFEPIELEGTFKTAALAQSAAEKKAKEMLKELKI